MKAPDVSIVMATYNRSHLIPESLFSILNQSFKNWECIIVDDGSRDNTQEVVKRFVEMDSRFIYLERSKAHHKGLPGCRNHGLDNAKGDYIIFFDDDDIVHPENLTTCIEILDGSEFDFCHYQKRSFTNDFKKFDKVSSEISKYPIGKQQIEAVVTNEIALASCTVIWRKECFDEERFIETLYYAEEWECYLRILLKGYIGIGINATLYYNRKHAKSNTGEFWDGNFKRRYSYETAIKLVIKQLKQKKILNFFLFRHFVQKSVFLKNRAILHYLFELSQPGYFVKLKYSLFYDFYPILVLGHRAKKYLKL